MAILALGHGNTEALVLGFLKQHAVFTGLAEHVQARLDAPPIVVDLGPDDGFGTRAPLDAANADLGNGLNVASTGDVADTDGEPLAAIGIGGIGQQAAIRADRLRAKAEIVMPLGEFGFGQHQLFGAARFRPPHPGAILIARFELPPIFKRAVGHRHRGVVLLHPAFQFFVQPILKGRDGRHLRFEIRIFGGQIGQHIGIIDGGIAGILQPVVRIFHRDAMVGEAVRAFGSDWRVHLGKGSGKRQQGKQPGNKQTHQDFLCLRRGGSAPI